MIGLSIHHKHHCSETCISRAVLHNEYTIHLLCRPHDEPSSQGYVAETTDFVHIKHEYQPDIGAMLLTDL